MVRQRQSLKRTKKQEENQGSAKKKLRQIGTELVSGKRSREKQAATLTIEAVLDTYKLDDLPASITTKYYGRRFPAWKIGMAMDRHVGALNFQGISSLRSVAGQPKYKKGIIPSKSTIQKESIPDWGGTC